MTPTTRAELRGALAGALIGGTTVAFIGWPLAVLPAVVLTVVVCSLAAQVWVYHAVRRAERDVSSVRTAEIRAEALGPVVRWFRGEVDADALVRAVPELWAVGERDREPLVLMEAAQVAIAAGGEAL